MKKGFVDVIHRLIGAIIVIGAMVSIAPIMLSMSTSPICNQGSYNASIKLCQIDAGDNLTCPASWSHLGQTCTKSAMYNDYTTQLIMLLCVAIVFIAGIVYIFREKQYS